MIPVPSPAFHISRKGERRVHLATKRGPQNKNKGGHCKRPRHTRLCITGYLSPKSTNILVKQIIECSVTYQFHFYEGSISACRKKQLLLASIYHIKHAHLCL